MANSKDPTEFKDPDRTLIRPNPGGRLVVAPSRLSDPLKGSEPHRSLRPQILFKTNPLASGAMDLIYLATRLRREVADPGSSKLREHCLLGLEDYHVSLKRAAVDVKTQSEASYCLATFIDEIVLETPWGAHGLWAKDSLLETLHQDSWGGERVFLLIDAWLEQPSLHSQRLEFILLLLRMGFRGKYGVIHHGVASLENLKGRIEYALGLPPVDRRQGLSTGPIDPIIRPSKVRLTPFWVLLSWAGLALCVVMILLMTRLENRSESLIKMVLTKNPQPPASSQ